MAISGRVTCFQLRLPMRCAERSRSFTRWAITSRRPFLRSFSRDKSTVLNFSIVSWICSISSPMSCGSSTMIKSARRPVKPAWNEVTNTPPPDVVPKSVTSAWPFLMRVANRSLNHADCTMDRILRAIAFERCSACDTMIIFSAASCASNQAAKQTEPSEVWRADASHQQMQVRPVARATCHESLGGV